MSYHVAPLYTEPTDRVELVWGIPYDCSPRIPASWNSPEEGGLEFDGDPTIMGVMYYDAEGVLIFAIDNIQEGSIAHSLLMDKYAAPSEGDCWDAICDHADSMFDPN